MTGDFDEDEYDDEVGEYWDEEDPHCCPCGRESCAEACEQCGTPLCPMCFETGAGFCAKHPDDGYTAQEIEAAQS